jgi:hypothetical protein
VFNVCRTFFDNCDGIFLNYTWTEENLETSADNAGSRHLNVYVGVDVFGRNCYGGGGFNTCQVKFSHTWPRPIVNVMNTENIVNMRLKYCGDVMLCRVVNRYQHCRRTYCFLFQGRSSGGNIYLFTIMLTVSMLL